MLPPLQDHWLPSFNFNVEEWDAEGQTYETLAIYTIPIIVPGWVTTRQFAGSRNLLISDFAGASPAGPDPDPAASDPPTPPPRLASNQPA
jgi:hypothetical protein